MTCKKIDCKVKVVFCGLLCKPLLGQSLFQKGHGRPYRKHESPHQYAALDSPVAHSGFPGQVLWPPFYISAGTRSVQPELPPLKEAFVLRLLLTGCKPGSATCSHQGTQLSHGSMRSSKFWAGKASCWGPARWPMMLFCGLSILKLEGLRPPSPSMWSLFCSPKESGIHNLTIPTFMIKLILDARNDHDFFQFCLHLVSQNGFDLLLIVFIDVALLRYLYNIMHWLSTQFLPCNIHRK